MLVDSHCHLNFPELEQNLDQVINDAKANGVEFLLTVNTALNEVTRLKEIAEQYANVFYSVGVHPYHVEDHKGTDILQTITEHLQHPKAIGIGETGLDYFRDNSDQATQRESFNSHLQAACEHDIPVIIHTRDADEDTIACIDQFKNQNLRGVFHCFSGSKELAKAALERGFYLSFSGIITFKNAEELREVVAFTPEDRILVETDSPYLAPVPHRGKTNQPAYTKINAEKVAEIKGLAFEKVCAATTDNFFKLFNKATKG